MTRIHTAAFTAILGTALLGVTAMTPAFAEDTKNDIHEDSMMSDDDMKNDMSDGMTAHDNMSKNGMTMDEMSEDHMSDDHMSGDDMSDDGKM